MRRFTADEKLGIIQKCIARPTNQTVADWCKRSSGRPSSNSIYNWSRAIFGKSFPYVSQADIEKRVSNNGQRNIVAEAESALGRSPRNQGGAALASALDGIARRDLIIEELLVELRELRADS